MIPYIAIAVGTGCGISVVGDYLRRTFFMTRHRATLERFTPEGKEMPFNQNTQELILKTVDRLSVGTEYKYLFAFFNCVDQDPITLGAMCVKSGVSIGLPPNLVYRSPNDIDKDTLTIGKEHQPIDWESEYGQKLENSLVLSDKAKSFVIARGINYGRTCSVYVDMLCGLGCSGLGVGAVGFVDYALHMQHQYKINKATRFSIVGITGLFFFALYMQMSGLYYILRDRKVDKKTARLAEDLAAGGVEYYEKTIVRNQALRALMGEQGAMLYSVEGEDLVNKGLTRMKLTDRKSYLIKYLQEYKPKVELVQADT